jgi:hypothetical protein
MLHLFLRVCVTELLAKQTPMLSTQAFVLQVTAVVSQPAAKQGRGRKLLPSPVSSLAVNAGISEDRLLCPETAREVSLYFANMFAFITERLRGCFCSRTGGPELLISKESPGVNVVRRVLSGASDSISHCQTSHVKP